MAPSDKSGVIVLTHLLVFKIQRQILSSVNNRFFQNRRERNSGKACEKVAKAPPAGLIKDCIILACYIICLPDYKEKEPKKY